MFGFFSSSSLSVRAFYSNRGVWHLIPSQKLGLTGQAGSAVVLTSFCHDFDVALWRGSSPSHSSNATLWFEFL
jgi:hypothetical protein